MLVIEGGDLVGKSTLVKECCRLLEERAFGHMPLHLTRPPKDFDYLGGYTQKMSRDTVWDRFHLSCLAYRSLDEHPCDLTPVKWDLVEASFRLHRGFMVLIVGNDSTIEERYSETRPGQEHMYSLEHALAVNRKFGEMVASYPTFNMRDETYHLRFDYIINEADNVISFADEIVDLYATRYVEFAEMD